jgi:hypothetical protein
MEKYVNVVSYL